MGPPGVGAVEPEAKGQQDLQHAVDLYQKGMGIAHGATTFEDHCRAIESFSLAIAIRPTQARFFLARGNAFRAIGELERAAKDYGSALALDDRSALYYANRGACYRKLNQTAKALEDLTNAIELDGRKAPHYFNRALVLHDAGFYREAIVDFSKALEDGSTAAAANAGAGSSGGSGTTATPPANGGGIGIRVEYRALQTRANCYRRLGHLSKCIEDLQAAIKLDPRNASAFSALALAHFECGDFERSADGFTRAIELNSGNASYFSYRGLCYYRQGQAAAAKQRQQQNAAATITSGMGAFARQCLADFNKCIQLDGRDPQAYFYRGSVRLALSLDLDQAPSAPSTTTSNSSIDAKPVGSPSTGTRDEPIFLEARGLMLQEIRVHPLALADFSYALELLEGFEESSANTHQILGLRYLRGESALRLGRFQDAVDDCSAAIAGGYTADMAAHNARGMALRGLGDYDRALRDLNACVTQEPKNDTFRFHRALCLMECMRYYEALPDLHETATRNSSDTKLLYYIGLCYYHEHQPSECVVFMKRALQCTPPQELLPDLYYHMGLSYALEGQNMDAVEHFTSAYDHSLLVGTSIEVGNNQEDELHDAGDKQNQLQQLHEAQLLYIHERAKALQLERYHAEALADFSFVITQQPTNAHAYFRRGFAHKALGDFNAAAHDLQTARLLDPNNLQLVVNYKELRDVECIVLCAPGEEKRF
uniref:Uncharacterized protein n=1 Tax=Phytophthora fragariae TaxID=53985 RepID=A0A6A3FT42_9STRA|nr:hypothetical protein PF009_g3167 [Phytophthora fragariae]